MSPPRKIFKYSDDAGRNAANDDDVNEVDSDEISHVPHTVEEYITHSDQNAMGHGLPQLPCVKYNTETIRKWGVFTNARLDSILADLSTIIPSVNIPLSDAAAAAAVAVASTSASAAETFDIVSVCHDYNNALITVNDSVDNHDDDGRNATNDDNVNEVDSDDEISHITHTVEQYNAVSDQYAMIHGLPQLSGVKYNTKTIRKWGEFTNARLDSILSDLSTVVPTVNALVSGADTAVAAATETFDTVSACNDDNNALISANVDNHDVSSATALNNEHHGFVGCNGEASQRVDSLSRCVQDGAGRVVENTRAPVRDIQIRNIPEFNASELRQRVDFRDINLDNPEQVPNRVRERLSGVIERALEDSPPPSVLNVILRGPSLASDVQAVLNADNEYNVDLFMEEISQVLQSNDDSMTDDELEFIVTVARDSRGGSHRLRLGQVSYEEILAKKGRHLYNPDNMGDNNLCFSICLAHFVNNAMAGDEKLEYAKQLYTAVGFDHMHKVSFSDVTKFEKHLDMKIIVFHHGSARKRLQCFQTCDAPHKRTVWLYLHNDHYYLIENQTGFFGASYVCEYCYDTYERPLYHNCKHSCNVCFTQECHTYQGRTLKCPDCKRICKSQFCFKQHKVPEVKHKVIPCTALKYCEACGKTYKLGKKKNAQMCTPCLFTLW
ncbi:uncharacterized protein LOC119481662 isoform X1 [Sebastes umbrosus]|uniref:uncharacterized protein LOC119481662 isoform X1 n=1 Tax=Sebastes umbrosus TaxID=72105 RepID=UPI0018A08B1D|nr:uncharacterized protein LOC119481662 isoform X1 [Sebastes umbrosus]XP_037614713.1 uncharacterized protein LOC119481662 isoform X1 [Sebastes umbrosus]XP_037614714.1 uncharacterized protein LOC119481662 isoform X1 [Sebastes umbrosus]XP_037614715.1 uncharacterized protein LOC119481662 isoform X1 [Sebastes umbrosus]XP_037614716.1 uncharacterized protein LOC119481662 isoform X1 [Sebastes umbrosus]